MSDEQHFRSLLDDRGVLRGDLPAEPAGLRVFSQRSDAMLDVSALRTYAQRWFNAKVGLTVDKDYDDLPRRDIARVVIASASGNASRLVLGRPAEAGDLVEASIREAGGGILDLAKRCPTIWAIEGDDKLALLLAAVFAGVLLGPVMTERELFGVKTAREKLGV